MKVNIYVTLKDGVLEPQGKSVHSGLESLGYKGIKSVRIGKFIEMDIEDGSDSSREEAIKEMCKKVLSNPVIENYRIKLESL